MAQRRILGLKQGLRLEWRGKNGDEEA